MFSFKISRWNVASLGSERRKPPARIVLLLNVKHVAFFEAQFSVVAGLIIITETEQINMISTKKPFIIDIIKINIVFTMLSA